MSSDPGVGWTPTTPGITVTGEGAASAAPDIFVVDVAAEVSAATPVAAFETASAGLQGIIEAAVAAGVSTDDLRSGGMSLSTGYDRDGQPSGFRAALTLEVRVRDLNGAGSVLASLVEAGSDSARVRGTRFEHSDPTGLAATARDDAFAQARRLAQRYAALSERPLGAVVQVVDGAGRGEGGPRPMAVHLASDAGGPPVQAGALVVSATVTVSWAWG